MVGAGAHDRQPQCHIHTVIEIEHLDRDQRLIVVHADRHVIGRPGGGMEHRIGGQGPDRGEPRGAQARNRRRNDIAIFMPHPAIFTGVGVQPGHGDARCGNAEIACQRGGGDVGAAGDQAGGQQVWHV